MANQANAEIRTAAKDKGVRLWEVAERYGLSEGNFSRKMRRELNSGEKAKLLSIIDDLAAERLGVC